MDCLYLLCHFGIASGTTSLNDCSRRCGYGGNTSCSGSAFLQRIGMLLSSRLVGTLLSFFDDIFLYVLVLILYITGVVFKFILICERGLHLIENSFLTFHGNAIDKLDSSFANHISINLTDVC
ncbi:hypothetical protein D3C86_1755570 [compost metagenome]